MKPRDELNPVRILFVCLGNICRSPTAEAVMADHIARAGLSDKIEVDSAGTGDWHIGSAPDPRATAEAESRGISMRSRGRQIRADDFKDFDIILAMDAYNLRDLRELAPDDEARSRIHMFRSFDPTANTKDADIDDAEEISNGELDVPDPYFGGPEGFSHAFDLVDAASEGLLDYIRTNYLGQQQESPNR